MKFVDGWVDTAGEVNLMTNSMSRQGYAPTHLVLHGTAGGSDAYGVANFMGGANVSTHFVISTDGTIVQCVSCDQAAWANAPLKSPRLNFDNADVNPNYWTISIEFAKPDMTNQINITDAQFQAGVELAGLICSTYNIPKRRSDGHGGIIGHCDINSVDRAMCPGTFPWDQFYAALNPPPQEEKPLVIDLSQVSQFFTDGGNGTWLCKNGKHIKGAILRFYQGFGNSGLCGLTFLGLPLTEELAVSTAHPEVKVQQYERGILAYDPNNVIDSVPGGGDVYLLHVDKGPGQQIIAQSLIDPLQKQITDLKSQLAAESNVNVTLLQQQNTSLQNKINQAKAALA